MSDSGASPTSSMILISLIIIMMCVIIPIKNKLIKYALVISLIYVLNLVLIGFNTAQQTCLPGKSKTGVVIAQSFWAPLFGILILVFINIPALKGFFQGPFIDLFGHKYGQGLAEGFNIMGICWAGELMTYFNIQKKGCST